MIQEELREANVALAMRLLWKTERYKEYIG